MLLKRVCIATGPSLRWLQVGRVGQDCSGVDLRYMQEVIFREVGTKIWCVCVCVGGTVQLRLNAVLVSSGLQVGRETARGDKTASTESEHKVRSLGWRPELDLFVRRRENALLRRVRWERRGCI